MFVLVFVLEVHFVNECEGRIKRKNCISGIKSYRNEMKLKDEKIENRKSENSFAVRKLNFLHKNLSYR